MKHQQFILGMSAAFFNNKPQWDHTVVAHDVVGFVNEAQPFVALRQRAYLETDNSYRQLLPYVIFRFMCPVVKAYKYFVYRRLGGIGEQKLVGKTSIGFGGHVDLADMVGQSFGSSIPCLRSTLNEAMRREIEEEIAVVLPSGENGNEEDLLNAVLSRSSGLFIKADTDPEDKHLGIVTVIELKAGTVLKCLEEKELQMVEPMTGRQLLDSGLELEAWTRLFLEHLMFVVHGTPSVNTKMSDIDIEMVYGQHPANHDTMEFTTQNLGAETVKTIKNMRGQNPYMFHMDDAGYTDQPAAKLTPSNLTELNKAFNKSAEILREMEEGQPIEPEKSSIESIRYVDKLTAYDPAFLADLYNAAAKEMDKAALVNDKAVEALTKKADEAALIGRGMTTPVLYHIDTVEDLAMLRNSSDLLMDRKFNVNKPIDIATILATFENGITHINTNDKSVVRLNNRGEYLSNGVASAPRADKRYGFVDLYVLGCDASTLKTPYVPLPNARVALVDLSFIDSVDAKVDVMAGVLLLLAEAVKQKVANHHFLASEDFIDVLSSYEFVAKVPNVGILATSERMAINYYQNQTVPPKVPFIPFYIFKKGEIARKIYIGNCDEQSAATDPAPQQVPV